MITNLLVLESGRSLDLGLETQEQRCCVGSEVLAKANVKESVVSRGTRDANQTHCA
jgi:hypothetical protein